VASVVEAASCPIAAGRVISWTKFLLLNF
jgi:hypothetical protein